MKKFILAFLAVIFAATIGVKADDYTLYDVNYYYDCEITNNNGEVVKAYDLFLEDESGEIEVILFADEFSGENTIVMRNDLVDERRV